MKNSVFILAVMGLMATSVFAQQEKVSLPAFEKIIISPHIEAVLIAGDEESVVIDNAKVPMEKLNFEVEGRTLRLYLDGAKTVTKAESVSMEDWRGKRPIYQGTMATVTVTYKNLEHLSVRGEEIVRCKSPLVQDHFKLTVYGEAKVYFNEVDFKELTVSIYGESYFEMESGKVGRQVYRAYGESEVNTLAIANQETKITAYGESSFRVKVDDRLKVTCYGEAVIAYKGSPDVDRGIIIGEAEIRKIG